MMWNVGHTFNSMSSRTCSFPACKLATLDFLFFILERLAPRPPPQAPAAPRAPDSLALIVHFFGARPTALEVTDLL